MSTSSDVIITHIGIIDSVMSVVIGFIVDFGCLGCDVGRDALLFTWRGVWGHGLWWVIMTILVLFILFNLDDYCQHVFVFIICLIVILVLTIV